MTLSQPDIRDKKRSAPLNIDSESSFVRATLPSRTAFNPLETERPPTRGKGGHDCTSSFRAQVQNQFTPGMSSNVQNYAKQTSTCDKPGILDTTSQADNDTATPRTLSRIAEHSIPPTPVQFRYGPHIAAAWHEAYKTALEDAQQNKHINVGLTFIANPRQIQSDAQIITNQNATIAGLRAQLTAQHTITVNVDAKLQEIYKISLHYKSLAESTTEQVKQANATISQLTKDLETKSTTIAKARGFVDVLVCQRNHANTVMNRLFTELALYGDIFSTENGHDLSGLKEVSPPDSQHGIEMTPAGGSMRSQSIADPGIERMKPLGRSQQT